MRGDDDKEEQEVERPSKKFVPPQKRGNQKKNVCQNLELALKDGNLNEKD